MKQEDGLKQCSRCKNEKLETEFYEHPTHVGGRMSVCKECKVEQQKEYNRKNVEKRRQYDKERYRRSKKQDWAKNWNSVEEGEVVEERELVASNPVKLREESGYGLPSVSEIEIIVETDFGEEVENEEK